MPCLKAVIYLLCIYLFIYLSVVGFSFREGSVLGHFDRCSHSKKSCYVKVIPYSIPSVLELGLMWINSRGSIIDASYIPTTLYPWLCKLTISIAFPVDLVPCITSCLYCVSVLAGSRLKNGALNPQP